MRQAHVVAALDARHGQPEPLALLRSHDVVERHTQELLAGVAEGFERGVVDRDEAACVARSYTYIGCGLLSNSRR